MSATTGDLLQVTACDRCPATPGLVVRVRGALLCSDCWKAAGQPPADDLAPAHELEVQTRERMTARGGTDRHLVRKGLS